MDNPHYVTPEEAFKMFCPMGMNYNGTVVCAGSKCMAWRWREETKFEADGPLFPRAYNVFSTTHGYCGMVRT